MSELRINVSLKTNTTPSHYVSLLCPCFDLSSYSSLHLAVDFHGAAIVFPEHLALIVAAVKYVKHYGKKVYVHIMNEHYNEAVLQYVSRINFFTQLGIEHPETFNRRDSSGRFIEISSFFEPESFRINDELVQLIHQMTNIDASILEVLNFCLWEVIDNVNVHSSSSIGGIIAAQNYPVLNEIRIIIADCGMGIRQALEDRPDGLYRGITNEEAVARSVEQGVTNTKGRGNGLFFTKEILKLNKGVLQIYSGNNFLLGNAFGARVLTSPYWQGTIVFLRFNKNTLADYRELWKTHGFHYALDENLENSLGNKGGQLW